METSNDRLENNSIYQNFDEKEVAKTVLKSEKTTMKDSNVKSNNESLSLPNPGIFSSSYFFFLKRITRNYSFCQEEKLIQSGNEKENDTYQNYYYNGDNIYWINIEIEADDHSKVYICVKVYSNSLQLSILGLDNSLQLYESNNKFINAKSLYSFKEILFYVSITSSSGKYSYNEIYRKIDINIYFPESDEYSSFFKSFLLKIIDEHKSKRYNINQIEKDFLIKGYSFILSLEKIKAIEILLSRKYQKMLGEVPEEEVIYELNIKVYYEVNYTSILLDDYEKYNDEKETSRLISEFANFCENNEVNVLNLTDNNPAAYERIIVAITQDNQ